MTDWSEIHAKMLELEDQSNDPRNVVPVNAVIGKMLDIDPSVAESEKFGEILLTEARRAISLFHNHYGPMLGRTTPNAVYVGFLQDITFAAAVQKLKKGD